MSKLMKRKELESILGTLETFQRPKVLLEQYQTSAELASTILHTMEMNFGDIRTKIVADLGCGCGTFLAGAAAMGAQFVVGFDIDEDALEICQENVNTLEINDTVDLVQIDVTKQKMNWTENFFDVVVMNPPFGTKRNEGIDMKFLKAASKLTKGNIYSLHKSSTREHVIAVANDWNLVGDVLAQLRFDLPRTMKFHTKNSCDIEVDFIRFERKQIC